MCAAQVVKLLLQSGANASDRNTSGLSALDMAKEEHIKELLRSSVNHTKSYKASSKHREPGEQHQSVLGSIYVTAVQQ